MKKGKIILFAILLAYVACENREKDHKSPAVTNSETKCKDTIESKCSDFSEYIQDAKFKIYLLMAAEPVRSRGINLHNDTLYYGECDLKLISCEQQYGGIWVGFQFAFQNNLLYFERRGDKDWQYSSVVFYREGKLDDYFFVTGDPGIVNFSEPIIIDTLKVIDYYKSNKPLNDCFKEFVTKKLIEIDSN